MSVEEIKEQLDEALKTRKTHGLTKDDIVETREKLDEWLLIINGCFEEYDDEDVRLGCLRDLEIAYNTQKKLDLAEDIIDKSTVRVDNIIRKLRNLLN